MISTEHTRSPLLSCKRDICSFSYVRLSHRLSLPNKTIIFTLLLATLYFHNQLIDLDKYASYAQQQTLLQDSNVLIKKQQDDLVSAESADLSTISHVINIDGWPSVNQMWPTTNTSSSTVLQQLVDQQKMPFIFSDKARKTDYDLLLSMNQTLRDNLNSNISQSQVQINLSFEYYFDYDLRVTALPAIKVDVDRVQFKNLIPTRSDDALVRSTIPLRQWISFNEQLPHEKGKIAEDWLKISLVNRESPSLVAMRKLKLEFLFRSGNQQVNYQNLQTTTNFPPGQQTPVVPSMGRSPQPLVEYQASDQVNPNIPINSIGGYSSTLQSDTRQSYNQYAKSPAFQKDEHLIVDIVPNKQTRLNKRDVAISPIALEQQQSYLDQLVTLTCYNSRECDWLSASGIEWSLASMPPANDKVKYGYYYNSDQVNYGDPARILNIYLTETELATKAHQLSDHCIDLALFVNGNDVKLRMIRLTRENGSSWIRGNPTVVWSSTTVDNNRVSLPNSTLASIQDNGWIEETVCFNEFFGTQNCGSGQCALGFEMVTLLEDKLSLINTNQNSLQNGSKRESVVAVALSSPKVFNKPIKAPVAHWLNTWQRPESSPRYNWNFRPKSDWRIDEHNATLINLYDQAAYTMTSDWLEYTPNIDLTGSIIVSTPIKDEIAFNKTAVDDPSITRQTIFSINVTNSIVDSNFSVIHKDFKQFEIDIKPNATDQIFSLVNVSSFNAYFKDGDKLKLKDDKLFKLMSTFDISIAGYRNKLDNTLTQLLSSNLINFNIKLVNVSVSDRCYPSPCSFGVCEQIGTGLDDWQCKCHDKYWGRQCNFGKWCEYSHMVQQQELLQQRQSSNNKPQITASLQASKLISGNEYCLQKLGNGFNCTNMEVALDENSYDEEGKTFRCSCQNDYYLSDDSKCRQAHKCNSIMCPSIGMTCDMTKPFNETRPCRCDETQDWYEDPLDPINGCVRKQCHNRKSECGFDAHVCLPTVPGEKPICKCGDKFRLEIDAKDGTKSCKSTACVLPSLNDCDQICLPNDTDRQRPYTCACHPGYRLSTDQRTCRPIQQLSCRPLCQGSNQICTQAGCKCKPGYLAEGEIVVDDRGGNSSGKYTQSVRCLNVCSTSYAENRDQFDKIQQVCPLGLCDPVSFRCRCSDGLSNSLLSSRYEPRSSNSSAVDMSDLNGKNVMLGSPLCRLRRVCAKGSNSYRICNNQGAICVPDYSKTSMFDCVCPPSTEKKFFGQGTINEFTCEPKCASKRYDCLRQQAVCKLLDKDKVGCDCLPGFIHNQTDHKCFIAKYSYSFQLLLVNKYYEPESKYHRLIPTIMAVNGTHPMRQSGLNQLLDPKSDSQYIHPQFRQSTPPSPAKPGETNNNSHDTELLTHEPQPLRQPRQQKSIFLTDLNQCNITTLIPKTVLEDPYESDLDPFVDTIEECNARIHDNVRKYRLNSDLVEDVRQSLRQIIFNPFTVTVNNSYCLETDKSGQYLNCTIYLQSNFPVDKESVEKVFSQCDSNSMDNRFCWIKPRILLQKMDKSKTRSAVTKPSINFHQIIPCELDGFCGLEAQSARMDNETSYCSCKCPNNVDVIDVKDLLPRHDDPSQLPVKQICALLNHCMSNSTFCLYKPGSACHYDVRSGAQCRCIPSSYENKEGHCVEVASSELDNTLIILVILLGTALVVSVTINLFAAARSEKFIGKRKDYPLREFSTTHQRNTAGPGLSNPAFLRD